MVYLFIVRLCSSHSIDQCLYFFDHTYYGNFRPRDDFILRPEVLLWSKQDFLGGLEASLWPSFGGVAGNLCALTDRYSSGHILWHGCRKTCELCRNVRQSSPELKPDVRVTYMCGMYLLSYDLIKDMGL